MDWDRAIEINREALERVIAVMFALAARALGHVWVLGRIPASAMLPRSIHGAILVILRPAESAVRRLIIIAERGIVLKLAKRTVLPGPSSAWWKELRPEEERKPAFQMIDPLKDYSNYVPFLLEPEPAGPIPRISVPGLLDPIFPPAKTFLLHDGTISAGHICRRLLALRDALDDLPGQARRLVRWQARQKLIPPGKPGRLSSLRPGFAPGLRRRQPREIDAILRECHSLAIYSRERRDSS